MKQPDLGKKIAELRLAKGLTQAELAEKCNLSPRTIQRIESADVTPRSFTVKLIFSSLDYEIYSSFGKLSYNLDRTAYKSKSRLRQFYRYVLDLFNLKTNTMKKVTILSVVAFAIIFGLTSLTRETQAQSAVKVQKLIKESNDNFKQWFNSGQFDLLAGLYRDDACIVSKGCGKQFIKNYYENEAVLYRFTDVKATDVSVSDSIAVEKGMWEIGTGEKMSREYLLEWRLTGNKCLIVNEMSALK